MIQAAKLVIIDGKGKYLLLERNNHPRYGNDPDLPGGTVEEGESVTQALVREVFEEAGIAIDPEEVQELHAGTDYSRHGNYYALYRIQFTSTPEVKLSWEHASYRWLTRVEFLKVISSSEDTYMQMVYDTLAR